MMLRNLLCLLASLMVYSVSLGQGVGSWQSIPAYGGDPVKIIDNGRKVMAVSQNKLMSLDLDSEELLGYSTENYLTDNKVDNIYYNFDRRFAVVVYTNGNIDLVYDDGRTMNMPALRDAQIGMEKRVRDVSFYNSRIYLAGEFGYICIDENTVSVLESVTDEALMAAFVVDGRLVVCTTGYQVKWSPVDQHHYTLSTFNDIVSVGNESVGIADGRQFYSVSGGELYAVMPNEEWTAMDYRYLDMRDISGKLSPLKSGGYFVYNGYEMALLDNDGNITKYSMPEELAGKSLACYNGIGEIWAASADGVACYGYDAASGRITLKMSPFRPDGVSGSNVRYIHQGASGRIYFVSDRPSNHMHINGHLIKGYVDYIEDGSFHAISPSLLPHVNNNYPADKNSLYGNYRITESPHEPGTVLLGNFYEGMYKMSIAGDVTGKYDSRTSTLPSIAGGYANGATDQGFDRAGNMWVIAYNYNEAKVPLHFLSADKCAASTTTASDWKSISLGSFKGEKEDNLLICSRSNMIFIGGSASLAGYDTKGSWSDLGDDSYMVRSSFTDQDGLTLGGSDYYIALAEDHDGKVWVGHRKGLFVIASPASFMSGNFNVNRVKVPRNDGTSLADYLMDGEQVNTIAVDGANRKWIGTYNSGLYLVSADGTEILNHFTADNSGLPSNCIYDVLCDASTNRVYVGTDAGLSVYLSDASAPHDDYSDVYAYPNPVRPEYSGPVTVTGLMDNSLVKIADSAGNVFYTGRSQGGMVTWDGCDSSGRRARTGVYYVFMSQSDGSSSSGAVAKILVVN
ncbi:MAG: hypothetical protein K2L49_01425 [Muribaculaceae bacterium]|nr:hypothetical protein [Muribaculaceae bacterium]